jgi:transcriptional regulator with XRE-family HTH domain
MGSSRRPQPERLAEKLLEIRLRLELSQSQMLRRLGDTKTKIHAAHLSGYESGKREPSLVVLLQYARAAGVPVEVLIDDEQNLPKVLLVDSAVWVIKSGQLRQQGRRTPK